MHHIILRFTYFTYVLTYLLTYTRYTVGYKLMC